jgi:hypothetical protein
LWFLVALAGCGFDATTSSGGNGGNGGGGSMIDAPPGTVIDAPTPLVDAAIDAPPDAPPDAAIDAPPPMWVVISTLTVPCNGQVVTSPVVLATGIGYRLRASGECTTNPTNGSRGDAEFFGYNVGTTYDSYDGVDNGIAINDTSPGTNKFPTWGTYTSGHVYQVDWTGTGTTTTAMFHDSNPGNNTGSLTLTISAYQ